MAAMKAMKSMKKGGMKSAMKKAMKSAMKKASMKSAMKSMKSMKAMKSMKKRAPNAWMMAVKKARTQLGITGFVLMGKGPDGKKLYAAAKAIHMKNK